MSLFILCPDTIRRIISYITSSSDLYSLLLTSSKARVTLLSGLKELEFTRMIPLSKLIVLFPCISQCLLSGTILVDIPVDSVQWDKVIYKDLTLSLTLYLLQPELLVPLFQAAMRDSSKRLTVYDHKDILLGEALEGYVSDSLRYSSSYRIGTMIKYPLHGEKQLKHYPDIKAVKGASTVDRSPKAIWIRGHWGMDSSSRVSLSDYPDLERLRADCTLLISSEDLGELRELGPMVMVYNSDENYSLDHPYLQVLNIRASSDRVVKWALRQRYDIVLWGSKRLLPLYRERYSHEPKVIGFSALDS